MPIKRPLVRKAAGLINARRAAAGKPSLQEGRSTRQAARAEAAQTQRRTAFKAGVKVGRKTV